MVRKTPVSHLRYVTVGLWTHETGRTQMMKAERSDSWLSTCVRKNQSAFKSCCDAVSPEQGEVRNNPGVITSIEETHLMLQVRDGLGKMLQFPTALSLSGADFSTYLQFCGWQSLTLHIHIYRTAYLLHWLSIFIHKKCKHISQFEAVNF